MDITQEPYILTTKEAAYYLRVTEPTVKNWIKRGVFEKVQVMKGSRIFIKRDDLIAHLNGKL
jgi:excisionase family DNA binding protein